MKNFFIIFALIAIVLAIYPFLQPTKNNKVLTGLPWQIEQQANGLTKVFGLTIGESQLNDALEIIGGDMELAIIASSTEIGNLEMYYGHYQAGLLSGKLVLQTNATENQIRKWRDNANSSRYMATGKAKKYSINKNDLTLILQQTITGLSFIPVTRLDQDVIIARFGVPQQRIKKTAVEYFLYPKKGLLIALSEEEKEVLQYVEPAVFQQWVSPLLKNESE